MCVINQLLPYAALPRWLVRARLCACHTLLRPRPKLRPRGATAEEEEFHAEASPLGEILLPFCSAVQKA